MDILTLPFVALWQGLALLFGGWWVWLLWGAAVIYLGARREMRPVWASLGSMFGPPLATLLDRLRRGGSNDRQQQDD